MSMPSVLYFSSVRRFISLYAGSRWIVAETRSTRSTIQSDKGEEVMPRYKVSFEYETEVEADDEHDAKLQVVEMWDWGNIGSMVVVEEIEESDISVVDKEIMTVKIDDVNNAIFNLNDLKETLKAHKLRDIKRVHEGTANEDTIGDLVDDLETFLLNTYNSLI